jgi:hypothetical protein
MAHEHARIRAHGTRTAHPAFLALQGGATDLVEVIDRRHAEAAEEELPFQRHPRYREFKQKVWVCFPIRISLP